MRLMAMAFNRSQGRDLSGLLERPYPRGISPGRVFLAFVCLFSCAGSADALDGFWVNDQGGNWSVSSNWDPANGVAGGADNTAYFGFAREASLGPNVSITVNGPETIGNLWFSSAGPGNWSLDQVSGGSLTLVGTFGPPEVTVTPASLQVTINAVVAGNGGVEKDGAGTLDLAGQNSYSGGTLATAGGLIVDGLIGSGGVVATNATLGGSGVILGPVVIGPGAALLLGGGPGPLSISNSLVLLPGSTTVVAGLSTNPLVQGLTSVRYGGTLVLSNLTGRFALGQSFSLFGSVSGTGNFSQIEPPPGPWLRWRFDPATGQAVVVSSASQPVTSGVSVSGNNLMVQFSSGPPSSPCYIIASPDLKAPKSAWTPIGTNVFDVSGNLTFTNCLSANGAGPVYLAAFVIPSP